MQENNNPKKTVRRVRQTNTGQTVPNKKVKQGTKVRGKGLLIGIVIFIFFIFLLVFGFFFYLTSHPNSANNLGIGPSTVKSISYIFAALVFGSIFVLFLIMGLIYVYKLSTQTENRKKNTIGAVVIFILGLINLVVAFVVFNRIYQIKVDSYAGLKDVLIAKVNFMGDDLKTKYFSLFNNKGFKIIAPVKISFSLNKRIYNYAVQDIQRKVGNIAIKGFSLDCGNGQVIKYRWSPTKLIFPLNKYCLYLKKTKLDNPYKAKLSFTYKILRTNITKKYTFSSKNIAIDSALKFVSKYKLNDAKNEITVGRKGDIVRFNTEDIPQDLGLKTNYVSIDFEGQGKFKKYKGEIKHIYYDDKKYDILIKIPEFTDYPYFSFPVRVGAPDKPICTIEFKNYNGKYVFKIKGEKANYPISSYRYKLKNITTDSVLKTGKGESYRTILRNGSDYQMEAIVTDTKKKKGRCKSEVINLSNHINYKFDTIVNGEKTEDENITVSKLPSRYKLEIKNITPDKDGLVKGFDTDGDLEIDEQGDTYEFKISKKKDKIVSLIVYDEYGNKTIKTLTFKVDLKPLIIILKASPYKGEVPLKVHFDASLSEVTDDEDEIIYFNWDFGDGKINNNTSQGVIDHIYNRVPSDDEGYIAKVRIITKKGYKGSDTKKIFPKKQVKSTTISFPNNYTYQVLVNSSLSIRLQTSGSVREIEWDFGDGEIYTCANRECMSISHNFKKVGHYKIKAKVSYTDGSPITTAVGSIYVIGDDE